MDGTAVGDGMEGGRRPAIRGGAEHPWHGRRLSVGRGTREMLDHRPVRPDLVMEFAGKAAVGEDHYRHPA
ncbi:hypothetical protein SHO565_55810 [Streptomyces sp. HO565]